MIRDRAKFGSSCEGRMDGWMDLKKDRKVNQYRLRISDEEVEKLNHLMMITGKNKSDLIREALRTYYNLITFEDI